MKQRKIRFTNVFAWIGGVILLGGCVVGDSTQEQKTPTYREFLSRNIISTPRPSASLVLDSLNANLTEPTPPPAKWNAKKDREGSDIVSKEKMAYRFESRIIKEYQHVAEPFALILASTPPLLFPSSTPILLAKVIVSPKSTFILKPKSSEHKILAEIAGIVFEDVNGNTLHDPKEPGIPGVKVVLVRGGESQSSARGVETQITDKQGMFLFIHVSPGHQAVGLYEPSLPKEYHLTTDSTVVISVTEGDNGFVEFGVQSDTAENKPKNSNSVD